MKIIPPRSKGPTEAEQKALTAAAEAQAALEQVRDAAYTINAQGATYSVADIATRDTLSGVQDGQTAFVRATLETYLRSASAWVLVSQIAPARATQRGSLYIPFGDSITLGGWAPMNLNPDNTGRGMAWAGVAAAISHQRLRIRLNAGIFGNTTAQMLARVDTDVIAYRPSLVTVAGGTNDITQALTSSSTPITTWNMAASANNIKTIVQKLRAAGIQPVLGTIPPINSSWMNVAQAIVQWNAWIRAYGAAQGIPVIDMYAATVDASVNPPQWKAGYTTDGTHPIGPGILAMAQTAWSVLQNYVGGRSSEPLHRTATDLLLGVVPNPAMRAWNAPQGLPTGWAWDSASTNHVSEQVTDADGITWWRLTRNAATNQPGANLTITGLSGLAGHRVRVALRIKSVLATGGAKMNWELNLRTASASIATRGLAQSYTIDADGIYTQEFTAPANLDRAILYMRFDASAAATSGEIWATGITITDLDALPSVN